MTALQEPVRSVAAVGADIIRPRNQHSPRLCDVTAEKSLGTIRLETVT